MYFELEKRPAGLLGGSNRNFSYCCQNAWIGNDAVRTLAFSSIPLMGFAGPLAGKDLGVSKIRTGVMALRTPSHKRPPRRSKKLHGRYTTCAYRL